MLEGLSGDDSGELLRWGKLCSDDCGIVEGRGESWSGVEFTSMDKVYEHGQSLRSTGGLWFVQIMGAMQGTCLCVISLDCHYNQHQHMNQCVIQSSGQAKHLWLKDFHHMRKLSRDWPM